MTITRTLSHLTSPPRRWVHFLGLGYYKMIHNSTLNLMGDFTAGCLIQLISEDVVPLDYILFTKGHPTDPATGSFSVEVVNGYVKVWLHDEDLTNSLVYISDEPLMNTLKIVHLAITYNSSTKDLKIYKDGVPKGVSIVTGINLHSDPTEMGNLALNTSDVIFGQGIGKNGYVGKIVHDFGGNRVFTPTEIYNDFLGVKYDGGYPNTGKIVFSSDRFGAGYQLGVMNGDTTDPEPLFSLPTNIIHPRWRADGERLLFLYNTSSNLSSVNILINDGTGTNGLGTITKTGGDYRTIYSPNSNNGVANYSKNSQDIIYLAATNSFSTSSGSAQISSYFDQTSSVLHSNQVTRTGGYGNAFLDTSPNYTVYTEQQHSGSGQRILRTDSDYPFGAAVLIDSNTSGQKFGALRISNNEQKIAYTKVVSGYKQVFICNIDGSVKTQLTFDDADHEFCSFSPDDTKILYSSNKSGKWQLYIANVDGSAERNISNNNFNDRYADWKA